MDSLAAKGSLPSPVGRDCGREGLPSSADVFCKQNRAVFKNAQNIRLGGNAEPISLNLTHGFGPLN